MVKFDYAAGDIVELIDDSSLPYRAENLKLGSHYQVQSLSDTGWVMVAGVEPVLLAERFRLASHKAQGELPHEVYAGDIRVAAFASKQAADTYADDLKSNITVRESI
jgi:hypothetical protein